MTLSNRFGAALLAVSLVTTIAAHDYIPGSKQVVPILLKGGDLYTVAGGTLKATDLLFENGRITQIGKNLTPPAGSEVLSAVGQLVYPGLIDAYTNLGLIEIGEARATNDLGEKERNSAEVAAHIAYNPDSELLPTVRTNGITTALVVPTGPLITGRSSLMNLDGWTKEDAAERLIVGVHLNWPQASVINAWWMEKSPEDQKKEMVENLATLRQVFIDARSYLTAKLADPNIKMDLRWEAIIPVLTGEQPLLVQADDYRQIEAAVNFAAELHIRMVLTGGRESWKLTDLLKRNNIPVIYGSVMGMPMHDDDEYDLPFKTPKLLQDAGVKFCIATFDTWNARNLPFHAGYAVAMGLSPDEALRSITLSPAEILGVSRDLGSLEVGKKATFIVSTGDILDELTAHVTRMFIEGRRVDLNNKQLELYNKYQVKHIELKKR